MIVIVCFPYNQRYFDGIFVAERPDGLRVAGVMDDTAEKTITMVSKAADEEFSMDFFKDAVRY